MVSLRSQEGVPMQTEQCGIYVFWDNSNIYIPAQDVAAKKDGFQTRYSLRIHFENMYRLATANRTVIRAIAVGSVPPEQQGLWTRFQNDTGIAPELYERGSASGTEQGVDQCLQTHMLRALADEEVPRVAVLLTGDGSGYADGVGFHADLERMQKKGWGIEVLSWTHSCNRSLRKWAEKVGVFVALDSYYESITFLDGIRPPKNLSTARRQLAVVKAPHESSDGGEWFSQQDIADLARLREKEARTKKYNEKTKKRGTASRKKPKKRR